MDDEDTYEAWDTTTTHLAAYLVYCGHQLEEVEWDEDAGPGGTGKFVFEKNLKLLEDVAREASNRARVDPGKFSRCYGQVRNVMLDARANARRLSQTA